MRLKTKQNNSQWDPVWWTWAARRHICSLNFVAIYFEHLWELSSRQLVAELSLDLVPEREILHENKLNSKNAFWQEAEHLYFFIAIIQFLNWILSLIMSFLNHLL